MDRLFKKLTIVASLVCIVFLGLAAIEENFLREWKHYQNEFADILDRSATTPATKSSAPSTEFRSGRTPTPGPMWIASSRNGGTEPRW